jgi:uncharacterized protein
MYEVPMWLNIQFALAFSAIVFILDWVLWKVFQKVFPHHQTGLKKYIILAHKTLSISLIAYFWINAFFFSSLYPDSKLRSFVMRYFFLVYFCKAVGVAIAFLGDIFEKSWVLFRYFKNRLLAKVRFSPLQLERVGVRWSKKYFRKQSNNSPKADKKTSLQKDLMTRSAFLSKISLVSVGIPLGFTTYGAWLGVQDFRVRHIKIALPHLPKSFDGIRIGQISDIHIGSFLNTKTIQYGIETLLKEKPDVIFFTGDLVNAKSEEIKAHFASLATLKAPLGVFSVFGNHDYGDYAGFSTPKQQQQHLKEMTKAHQLLGWNLLRDENKSLTINAESIQILGSNNWGIRGRGSKYGDIQKTHQSSEDAVVKLLLSHDPSHWKAKVLPHYQDIDITFSGHTHGMQLGIDWQTLKWSPIQYIYDEWMDLYQVRNQYLYVNRGFGYADIFPTRVGILPELTLFTLIKS